MARLTITESARADPQEIRVNIAKDNPAPARRVVERLRAKARKLAQTPGIGPRREDLRSDLFSFPVGRHVLFYRLQAGGIVLVRVLHGARDLPALFSVTEPLALVGCPNLFVKIWYPTSALPATIRA